MQKTELLPSHPRALRILPLLAAGLIAAVLLIINGTPEASADAPAPVVTAGADAEIDEGGAFTGAASFTDSNDAAWDITIDYGDGSPMVTSSVAAVGSIPLSHDYADDGLYTVTISVDDGAESGSDSLLVTVNNVEPTITVVNSGEPTTGVEASAWTATGSFTDPGDDAWTATVDYGDGAGPEPLTLNPDKSFTLSHTYDNDFIYGVQVTIDDGSGPISGTQDIEISDVAPDVAALADQTITEGNVMNQAGSFSDPGSDAWLAVVDYGEGAGAEELTLEPGKTFTLAHTYNQNGTYTVTVTVTDERDDGSSTISDSETFVVTVNNIAPTIDPGVDATSTEGAPFSYTGTFSDTVDTNWAVAADFGDGSPMAAGTVSPDVTPGNHEYTLNHVFADNGTYTVTVTVSDGTDIATTTFDVVVSNVGPTITSFTVTGGVEGGPIGFNLEFADPGTDTWNVSLDPGDGSAPIAAAVGDTTPVLITYAYDDDGSFVAEVTVTDDDGASATQTVAVSVSNANPMLALNSDASVNSSGDYARTGIVSDLGVNDGPWDLDVDYGDGSPVETFVTATSGVFTLSHDYNSNSIFTVTITATDKDDGSVTVTTSVGVFVGVGPDPSLNQPTVVTVTREQMADFFAYGEDVWNPVTGGTGEVRWQIFYESWSASDSAGNIHYNVAFDWDFGASIGASTSGHVGMYGKASDLKGTVDIDYPVNVRIEAPEADSFLAGSRIPLPSGWTLAADAALNASASTGDLSLHGQLELNADAWATLCVFSCWSPTLLDVDTPAHDFKIVGIDDVEGASDVLALPAALIGLGLDLNEISVDPATMSINTSTGKITLQGENKFSQLTFDLDKIATRLGLSPPLGQELHIPDHFSGGGNLFDADAIVEFWASQSLSFEGRPIIELTFDPPVAGVTGDFISVAPDFSRLVYRAGAEVDVIFPPAQESPTTVTPRVWLENRLHNDTELRTDSRIDLKALDFFFNLESFVIIPGTDPVRARVCVDWNWLPPWECYRYETRTIIPGIPELKSPAINLNIGPAWGPVSVAELSTPNSLADGSFSIDGFESITLNSFELNPEVPPKADVGGPYTVDEGSTVLLTAENSVDADGDALTYAWDLDGDGELDDAVGETALFTMTADDAVVTVSVRVSDGLNHDEASTTVTVRNVDPVFEPQADATVAEGEELTRLFEFTDPGADTWDITIDWGDGSPADIATGLSVRELAGSHVYADDGVYTVSLSIVDDDGGTGSLSFTVTVLNVAPVVDAGGDRSISEGDSISLDPSTFSDAGTLDTHTATIDWGDGHAVEAGVVSESPFGPPGSTSGASGTVAGTHTYADNGIYTVIVTVSDDDGGVTTDTFTVIVGNVQPAIDAGPDVEFVIHDTATLAPSVFSDPGFDCAVCSSLEDFTVSINWGEGPDEAMTVAEAPGSPGVPTHGTATAGAHVYRLPGEYVVTVTVFDDDTAVASDTLTVKVLGPRDLKARAAELLAPFAGDHQLGLAIDAIEQSLTPEFWDGDVHLNDRYGHRVFSDEKQAVVHLLNALAQTGGKALSPDAADAAQAAIELLVNADRVIAVTKLLDAHDLDPEDSRIQRIVEGQVLRAESELAEGNLRRTENDWLRAIDSYRSSWHHSGVAIQQAGGYEEEH